MAALGAVVLPSSWRFLWLLLYVELAVPMLGCRLPLFLEFLLRNWSSPKSAEILDFGEEILLTAPLLFKFF